MFACRLTLKESTLQILIIGALSKCRSILKKLIQVEEVLYLNEPVTGGDYIGNSYSGFIVSFPFTLILIFFNTVTERVECLKQLTKICCKGH